MCLIMSLTTTNNALSVKRKQQHHQQQKQHKHKQHKRWPQLLHLINFHLKEEFYKYQSKTLTLSNVQRRQHQQHLRKNSLQLHQQHNYDEEQIEEQHQYKRQQYNLYYCHNKGKSRKLTGSDNILSLPSINHRNNSRHTYTTTIMILFALILVHFLPRISCAISPGKKHENFVYMPEVALKLPSLQNFESNSSTLHSNQDITTRWRRSSESINPLYGSNIASIRQSDNMASVYYGGGSGSTSIVSNGNHFITSNQHGVLYSVDNRKPAFKNCAGYKPSVKEEQPENTYVIMVEADDPDPDQEIKYSLVQSAAERPKFRINSSTGVIVTEHTFDRDEPIHEKAVYVTVQATDNGRPPLDDVCTFKVTIEDINDNPPVFDKARYDESMSEDIQVYLINSKSDLLYLMFCLLFVAKSSGDANYC